MALHTGTVELRDGDYFGPPLNRAARLLAAGHGGQVLLSAATQELVRDYLPPGVELRDMGVHRLKDLTRPEQIFQLLAPDLPADFPPLNTLAARPNNLPIQATTLIGREREIAAVCDLLRREDVRLITLTGPGGTGKTRRALQVAAELLDEVANGVTLVTLAPIGDPDLVASTIAQALGVRETGAQPLRETLKHYLCEKQILLLLDNFEQVADAAPLVAELLAVAPRLKILVTSRVPLHLSGEHEIAVPPLSLPDRVHPPAPERLTQYEAVRLFIERAQAVNADFAITNANAPAVAEICYRLDGLPLAIELAAARSKLFAPQALLARLGNRLKLLTGGARDLPERQQTIRNTIDWSYNLLDSAQQTLFARLGVFAGGGTIEAAEAVCNADGDLAMEVVDGIAALIDKSLLRQEEGVDGEPGLVMLEIIREYALERLEQRGEADTIRRRHATYCMMLAERAESELHGAGQIAWLNRLEGEHDNFRAALAWSQTAPDGAELGLRLAGMLGWFWWVRGHLSEGHTWLMGVLEHNPFPSSSRAMALNQAGSLLLPMHKLSTARSLYAESLTISRAVGDTDNTADALLGLGRCERHSGSLSTAESLFTEGLTLFRDIGSWKQNRALHFLGEVTLEQGDTTRARALFEECLAQARAQGDISHIAWALESIGRIAYGQGDLERAKVLYEESLALQRQLGQAAWLVASLLVDLGGLALVQGDYAQATARLEEGLAFSRETDNKLMYVFTLGWLIHLTQLQGDTAGMAAYLAESRAQAPTSNDKVLTAWMLNFLGINERYAGNYVEAAVRYEASLALCRALDDPMQTAVVLCNLGQLALDQADPRRAADLFSESLGLYQEHGNTYYGVACLAGLARLRMVQGQPERAARLLGAREAHMRGRPMDMDDRADHERALAATRAQLDDATFAAAWEAGHAMTIEQAITYALEPPPETPPAPPAPQPTVAAVEYPAGLTAREVEVLRLVARGLTDAQVAEQLVISTHTVHAHLRAIYGKLDVTSRAAATRFAVDHHLV